jgi:hypothetical protein
MSASEAQEGGHNSHCTPRFVPLEKSTEQATLMNGVGRDRRELGKDGSSPD